MSPQRLNKRRKDYCDCAWYSSSNINKLIRPAKETEEFVPEICRSCIDCEEFKKIKLMAVAESI